MREVLEVAEVMCCVLLCMLEVVEGRLCLLEVLEVAEVMCCVLLCMLEAVEGARGGGGDMLYATLLAGGVGGVGGDAMCDAPYVWTSWRVSSVCWR